MPLAGDDDRPSIFVSYAGLDDAWVAAFLTDAWWRPIRSAATLFRYKNDPVLVGSVREEMRERVEKSVAFMPILSRWYVENGGKIIEEDEFLWAVECYSKRPKGRRLFFPVILDSVADDWWSMRGHEVLRRNAWLKDENVANRDFLGPITPQRQEEINKVLEFVQQIRAILPPPETDAPPPPDAAASADAEFVVLGHEDDVRTDELAETRKALCDRLNERHRKAVEWPNGWLSSGDRKVARKWPRFIQPLTPREALALARDSAPDEVAQRVGVAAGVALTPAGDLAEPAPPVTLWLPQDLAADPLAAGFARRFPPPPEPGPDAVPAAPRACVASVDLLAGLLAPAGPVDMPTVTVEILDDDIVVARASTAQKLIEDKLRDYVVSATNGPPDPRGARPPIGPDDVWIANFADPKELAAQIANTSIVVANDSTLQRGRTLTEARRCVRDKVRVYANGLGDAPGNHGVLPVFLVISNADWFRDDPTLDAYLRGEKWRVLSLDRQSLEPDPASRQRLIGEMHRVLAR
ncbi:toll/interleukin-1 receptor domain-containing protein [Alsobacter sp. SYSU M60028]|uniref:Toll/interleukin-1 receptor domain-containing protein n=1 Tax=Alsobacter ponti TaxID=2962936 RepID=A0ABT1LH50_9HYPH|nr:toll/interleukin-1 receptor domain-containing protein [Alsobacter ponti]MCP8940825.1 toll/interleukin-1 receptor domain-containing protein [Alsobacter ponti]